MLQAFATCQTLAEAATSIVSSAPGLKLTTYDTNFALNALPFRRWGPVVRSLRLSPEWYSKPGLAIFLATASRLQGLQLRCTDVLTAAQASFLMSRSCAREIIIHGWHMPQFPAALSSLCVHFPAYESQEHQLREIGTPSALIYLLASQQSLVCLTLHFPRGCIMLISNIQLPELAVILHLKVQRSILRLSWLRQQPCRSLELHLTIQSPLLEASEAAVKELCQLPITILILRFRVPLSAQVQALWQQVAVSQHCTLLVPDIFGVNAGHDLCALPSCPDICIEAPDSRMPTGLAVSFPAVARQPGRVYFRLGPHQCLWFKDDCTMPAHLEGQAWQLVVHSAADVQGLPLLRQRAGVQYLQTPAAKLAGWTVP